MDQQQEEDYYEYPSPYQQQPAFRDSKADLLDKIRPDEIVELTRNKLMGKELNENGSWIINPELRGNAISALGAHDIANLVLCVANPSTSISKLEDKEIRRRAYSLMDTAIKMILANWKNYIITNTAQIWYVADIVYSITFIVMKQADSEGIRKMIIGTRSESHHIMNTENQKKSFWRRS